MNASWPKTSEKVDQAILSAANYIRNLSCKIRSAEDSLSRKKKKNGSEISDDSEKILRLYVAECFPEWQDQTLEVLKKTYNESTNTFVGDKEALEKAGMLKNKQVMPFAALIKKEVGKQGAFTSRQLGFPEMQTLEENIDIIRRELAMLKIAKVELVSASNLEGEDSAKESASLPGQPAYRIL